MQNSYERRRHRRLPIDLNIEVDRLFKQDNEVVDNINADIEVFDISKTGIGFVSEVVLPKDYYFDCTIGLGEKDFFRAVIKIVRVHKLDDNKISYGAEFVGLAQFLASKIDDYEKKLKGETVHSPYMNI